MKVVRSKCLLSHYPNDSRCKRLENIPRLNIPHARPKHGPSLRLAWGASIQVLILKLRAITLSCLTPFSLSAHIRCVHPLPTFMFTVPTLPRRQADSGPGRLTVIAHDMDVEGLHQDAAAEADLQSPKLHPTDRTDTQVLAPWAGTRCRCTAPCPRSCYPRGGCRQRRT